MNPLVIFIFIFIAVVLLALTFITKNFIPSFIAGGIFIIIGIIIIIQGIPEVTGTTTNTTTNENNETISIEENNYTYRQDVYITSLGSILVVAGALCYLTMFLFWPWRLDGY